MTGSMTPFRACGIIEDFDVNDHTEEEYLSAVQYLIDTGLAWTFQGFYGRLAKDLIDQGLCTPPGKKGKVDA